MESNWNLSERRCEDADAMDGCTVYSEEDVKEFIRLANEGVPMSSNKAVIESKDYFRGVRDMIDRLNKIAGEKLI